ncbi:MAG TPA: HNH endonuclease [Chitinivibrionales bacterium]|nr:HNH endonuclease [Chitinivibrionales bacterium]
MPPRYVHTIEQELFYEYAKLMSRSAFNGAINYGFVTDRFEALVSGAITMSGTIREWQRERELPDACVFCGAKDNLTVDHLIPWSRGGNGSSDNVVFSCKSCNSSRGDRGIFQWLGLTKKNKLHRVVAGKYLKELYKMHKEMGTLSVSTRTLDTLCKNCKNPQTCREWGTIGKLTSLCLESVF